MTLLKRIWRKKLEIKKNLKNNKNGQIGPTIVWDTVKAIIIRTAYLKKMKRAKYDELETILKKQGKEQKDADKRLTR